MRARLSYRLTGALVAAVIVVLADGATAAGLGRTCGGRLGIGCDRGLFCDLPVGNCGGWNIEGACTRIPRFCVQRMGRRVCGCDNRTYTNNCQRQRAVVSKQHEGRCDWIGLNAIRSDVVALCVGIPCDAINAHEVGVGALTQG